ncbi:MAG: hypothetical protein R3C68_11310 [Myxococcota bacterium]
MIDQSTRRGIRTWVLAKSAETKAVCCGVASDLLKNSKWRLTEQSDENVESGRVTVETTQTIANGSEPGELYSLRKTIGVSTDKAALEVSYQAIFDKGDPLYVVTEIPLRISAQPCSVEIDSTVVASEQDQPIKGKKVKVCSGEHQLLVSSTCEAAWCTENVQSVISTPEGFQLVEQGQVVAVGFTLRSGVVATLRFDFEGGV